MSSGCTSRLNSPKDHQLVLGRKPRIANIECDQKILRGRGPSPQPAAAALSAVSMRLRTVS